MVPGISLANKCQLLFGAAIVLIIGMALVVPWFRAGSIIDEGQLETSRQLAREWLRAKWVDQKIGWFIEPSDADPDREPDSDLIIGYWPEKRWQEQEFDSRFMRRARRKLDDVRASDDAIEFSEAEWDGQDRVYRYTRADIDEKEQVKGYIVVERRSARAARELFVNRVYLLAAGIGAGILAFLVFFFITTRIILSPVRALRDTAELVKEGNLHIRSEIRTGDEFEELSDAFNAMLANIGQQQQQLRAINASLDVRLSELAERNVALFEAARLKGEFLANVSHELRTPLNSIIGFAEILQEIVHDETGYTEEHGRAPEIDLASLTRRRRYLDNIVSAGRTLLEMINELLAMARIEAENIELHIEPMNVAETCDALIALIKPLADRKRINLILQLQASPGERSFVSSPSDSNLPLIESDPQKLQQVMFNFLSNAVKFTPDEGDVTLRAEHIRGNDGTERLRVSVLDTGPGIPPEEQTAIFEKFRQVDASHTRKHQGTGLGLAIAKQYAEMLQCEIQLESDEGRGSMFSVIVPLAFDRELFEQRKEAAKSEKARLRPDFESDQPV